MPEETTAKPASAAPSADPGPTMIPEQHAAETGNYIVPRGIDATTTVTLERGGTKTQLTGAAYFSPAHNAAAILHGWGKRAAEGDEPWGHRHHAGQPLEITRAAYLAALKAASETNELGEYEPHLPAMSEHCELKAHHKAHAERIKRHREDAKKAAEEAAKKLKAERKPADAPSTTEAPKV